VSNQLSLLALAELDEDEEVDGVKVDVEGIGVSHISCA